MSRFSCCLISYLKRASLHTRCCHQRNMVAIIYLVLSPLNEETNTELVHENILMKFRPLARWYVSSKHGRNLAKQKLRELIVDTFSCQSTEIPHSTCVCSDKPRKIPPSMCSHDPNISVSPLAKPPQATNEYNLPTSPPDSKQWWCCLWAYPKGKKKRKEKKRNFSNYTAPRGRKELGQRSSSSWRGTDIPVNAA